MPIKSDVDAVASPYAATMLESLPTMNFKPIHEGSSLNYSYIHTYVHTYIQYIHISIYMNGITNKRFLVQKIGPHVLLYVYLNG
jgi:hypothetical protein